MLRHVLNFCFIFFLLLFLPPPPPPPPPSPRRGIRFRAKVRTVLQGSKHISLANGTVVGSAGWHDETGWLSEGARYLGLAIYLEPIVTTPRHPKSKSALLSQKRPTVNVNSRSLHMKVRHANWVLICFRQ